MKLGFLYDIEEYWIVEVYTNGLHLSYARMFNKMFNAITFSLLIQIKSCVRNLVIYFLYTFLSSYAWLLIRYIYHIPRKIFCEGN